MVAENYPVLNALYPKWSRREPKLPNPKFIWAVLAMLAIMLLFCKVKAEEYSNEEIVNAIYWTEGGAKAKVAYGILSVKVKGKKEARQVCLNTIRNHRKRHANHKCGMDFLSCLARRYAPINCNNDNGTNKFWIRNLKYFLIKNAK